MSSNSDSLSVATTAAPAEAGVATASPGPLRGFSGLSWGDYLGVAPFLVFAVLFLIVPTVFLVIGAFVDNNGNFTLQNVIDLNTPQIVSSFVVTTSASSWRESWLL